MWKPLPCGHVFKPRGKAQRVQYLLAVGLDCYKWYQSHTSGGVPARTPGSQEGVDCEMIGEGNKAFLIRVWKPLPSGHESPKRIISASGGFEPLHQLNDLIHCISQVLLDMGSPISKELQLISFHTVSKGYWGECGQRGGYFEMTNIPPKV